MSEQPALKSESKAPPSADWRQREIRLAFTSALKLGSSLIFTWAIALVPRLYIPRFLGPERFGMLNFADAFTSAAFVLLGLGIDTYVRKEIAVRPEHANDFVAGVVMVRMALTILVYACMAIVLHVTHRGAEVRTLVYIYGIAKFFCVGSGTSAGLLQARGRVNEMSVLSVVTKLTWAAGIFVSIVLRLPLWAFGLAVVLSEGLNSLILFKLAKQHLKFGWHVDIGITLSVIVASLPFFVASLATTVYDKIGTSLLAIIMNDKEVGWYGAASALAGMTLMLVPAVAWVLIPLFARSAAVSEEDFYVVLRRSIEFILAVSIPLSLMMIVGSETWIYILFGNKFGPASSSLRVLATATVVMYLSIIAGNALAVLNLTWRMSLVFVGGMVLNPTLNYVFIRHAATSQIAGSGGAACATATLVTELAIAGFLLAMLGRRVVDRRLVQNATKSIAIAAAVVALDAIVFRRLGTTARLVFDLGLYGLAVLATGALDINGMIGMVRASRRKT